MTVAPGEHRVRTATEGDVWHVTLDNGAAGNVVDLAMAEQLAAAGAARPAATRAGLLPATGPRFCVGGDIGVFAAAEDLSDTIGRLATAWHGTVRAVLY